jgi:protein-disulfide isomerase
VKGRHLFAAIVALALAGAALSFGLGVKRPLSSRTATPSSLEQLNAPEDTTKPRADNSAEVAPDAKRSTESPQPPSGPQPAQASGIAEVDTHNAFGSKSAPITMEVYSDFQCPACKQLFKTTNQPLIDNYVNTGKVYLIHRDFPLPMHSHSREAASYARAAAHIGKFEAVEQALFQNQEKWEASGDVKGTVAAVLSAAEMKKVQALLDGKTLEPLIEKDKQAGQMIPVSQTPTTVFHCKGQTYPYAGVMSYDLLRQFLDQLLSQR